MNANVVRAYCPHGHAHISIAADIRLCYCGEWAIPSRADAARWDWRAAMDNVKRLRATTLPAAAIHANVLASLSRAADARRALAQTREA